jgi:hypothetical protein
LARHQGISQAKVGAEFSASLLSAPGSASFHEVEPGFFYLESASKEVLQEWCYLFVNRSNLPYFCNFLKIFSAIHFFLKESATPSVTPYCKG